MPSKTSNYKCCATCNHWGGLRKLSKLHYKVEYGNDTDKGECVCGGWNGHQQKATDTCSKWVKWSILKQ